MYIYIIKHVVLQDVIEHAVNIIIIIIITTHTRTNIHTHTNSSSYSRRWYFISFCGNTTAVLRLTLKVQQNVAVGCSGRLEICLFIYK